MPTAHLLAWPGMPSLAALDETRRLTGIDCVAEPISSNEDLDRRMAEAPGAFDVVFPSDYMVTQLARDARLRELDHAGLGGLKPLADWARDPAFDPGARHSVAMAFGTTGLLYDRRRISEATTWDALFRRQDSHPVGLLGEVREVLAAALLACGHRIDDLTDDALGAARELLCESAASVGRVSSDDFVDPVLDGRIAVHHAWSGPAARAVRRFPATLGYSVPDEGAVLWVTTAAVPADAPDPALSQRVIRALLTPGVARLTVTASGFATPNVTARQLLESSVRDDPSLFPSAEVLERCRILTGLPGAEAARLQQVWDDVVQPTAIDRRGS